MRTRGEPWLSTSAGCEHSRGRTSTSSNRRSTSAGQLSLTSWRNKGGCAPDGTTDTLVRIGAASRQELERIHAEHTARRAEVQSAAARLELLGLSVRTIESLGPGTPLDATIFARVRVGSAATITTAAYPNLVLQGRVGYIDPRVSPETRDRQDSDRSAQRAP